MTASPSFVSYEYCLSWYNDLKFIRYFLVALITALVIKQALFHASQILNSEFFELTLVADNDDKTPHKDGIFRSTLIRVILQMTKPLNQINNSMALKWILTEAHLMTNHLVKDRTVHLKRYMELSALTKFDGSTLTCDDRTGHILEVNKKNYAVTLWLDLGRYIPKFKCEWMTVKDGFLYAGSFGKTFDDPETSQVIHRNFLKVFKINRNKQFEILDWSDVYGKLKKSLSVIDSGFAVHEAIEWIPEAQKWVILPRREVNLSYTEENDDQGCSSSMLISNEDFSDIKVFRFGTPIPTRGFSDVSYSLLNSTSGELLYFIWASRTREVEDKNFNTDLVLIVCKDMNKISKTLCSLYDEVKVANVQKFEGLLARHFNSLPEKALTYFKNLKFKQ